MNIENICKVNSTWSEKTSDVMKLKQIPLTEMQELLSKTYEIFKACQGKTEVPKEACRLLQNIDEYLYFVSVFEGNDVATDFFHFQMLSAIVDALKNGFFGGEFEFFFKKEPGPIYMLNIKNGLQEFLSPENKIVIKNYNGIKLVS